MEDKISIPTHSTSSPNYPDRGIKLPDVVTGVSKEAAQAAHDGLIPFDGESNGRERHRASQPELTVYKLDRRVTKMARDIARNLRADPGLIDFDEKKGSATVYNSREQRDSARKKRLGQIGIQR